MGRSGAARVIMVQGTSSHAGKTTVAAALCRILADAGYEVAPFKSQNMSLNSYVTPDGGEIGRAQALQAEAARTAPRVEMNPVLLKPEGEHRSQVVVLGRPEARATAREYYAMRSQLWPVVTGALDRLREAFDVVVIEGAGSPAEINLREHEIVNMRVARYAQAPVLLVGDIDRGGVFASLVGTMELLEPEERALVKAFAINKFRGDVSILTPGFAEMERRTGVPVAGVLPFVTDLRLPEEDSLGLEGAPSRHGGGLVDVAVMSLPHIANFDDFDPLRHEPGVSVRFIANANALGAPDLIVLPGSKTTMADLAWLRQRGLAQAVTAARGRGTPVLGICGGFQMLGERLLDPHRVESETTEAAGLGLLAVTTVFGREKTRHQVQATVLSPRGLLAGCAGMTTKGYEIHMGETKTESPVFALKRRPGGEAVADGAMDAEGRTLGTYVHGLLLNAALRRAMVERIAQWKGVTLPPPQDFDADAEMDRWAEVVRSNLDMGMIMGMLGLPAAAR